MDGRNKLQGLEKRKACDLCHIKKIKCDNKKPECSHCIVYNSQCKYTPHIQKRRKEDRVNKRTKPSNNLESRLAQMEEKLRSFIDARETADEGVAYKPTSSHEKYPLPPSKDILPLVKDYFASYNSLTPIFQQESFMHMLNQWYSSSSSRDSASWAVINVVLALSLQNCASKPVDPIEVNRHVNNAQSVLTSLLARDQDLKGIQVLLGLVILFQGTPNPRSASILMATAVKLVHRLQLHANSAHISLDPNLTLERCHVFWITYILDRDISMRAHEPYLLQEKDIDVEFPEFFNAEDISGVLIGPACFQFLQSRAHLARIQGCVYDWTYAGQAEKLSRFDRLANSNQLYHMLLDWRRSIPAELQPNNFVNTVPPYAVRHYLLLYFTYFRTLYTAHRIFSHDAEWIEKLINYSQKHIAGPDLGTGKNEPEDLLPTEWSDILDASRTCMRLFRMANLSDTALIWGITCTYISALIILVANNLTFQEHNLHDHFEEDNQLVEEGLQCLDNLSKLADAERFQQLLAACSELSRRATMVATRLQSSMYCGQESGTRINAVSGATVEGVDEPSPYSALKLIQAFAQAEIKPLTPTVSWMRSLADLAV